MIAKQQQWPGPLKDVNFWAYPDLLNQKLWVVGPSAWWFSKVSISDACPNLRIADACTSLRTTCSSLRTIGSWSRQNMRMISSSLRDSQVGGIWDPENSTRTRARQNGQTGFRGEKGDFASIYGWFENGLGLVDHELLVPVSGYCRGLCSPQEREEETERGSMS